MSITTANAVVMLGIIPLFPIPQQIQGFASDEVYDVPSIKSAEALMGVDGKKSSGFVYVLIPQTITLQADVGNATADMSNSASAFGLALTAPVAQNASYANLESTVTATSGSGGAGARLFHGRPSTRA